MNLFVHHFIPVIRSMLHRHLSKKKLPSTARLGNFSAIAGRSSNEEMGVKVLMIMSR